MAEPHGIAGFQGVKQRVAGSAWSRCCIDLSLAQCSVLHTVSAVSASAHWPSYSLTLSFNFER